MIAAPLEDGIADEVRAAHAKDFAENGAAQGARQAAWSGSPRAAVLARPSLSRRTVMCRRQSARVTG
jgi:hypothetical protein